MTANSFNSRVQEISQYVNQEWQDSALPILRDYIRIPNKSPMFDPDWHKNGHMHEAVEMLSAWAQHARIDNMQLEIIELPTRTPIIFAEIPAFTGLNESASSEFASEQDPEHSQQASILLYGHYDKQPEFDGWHEDLAPWTPVEKDGKLYGRGGADDGYAIFASLIAIAALQAHNIPHPRCVLLIEGCEESGSFDLPYYVDHLKPRIGKTELVICLDAECGNYDQLWLTTSLRGMLPGILDVQILTEGQHSGAAGGIVPSSFRIVRQLIERVENAQSGALHKLLHVDVPEQVIKDAHAVAQVLGPQVVDRFPWVEGAHADNNDMAELIVRNSWHPSLATVGLAGTPTMGNAGNTIRPGTQAKLVFRLPPTLDAQQAAAAIKNLLEQEPPYGASIKFNLETPQTGWCAPTEASWLNQSLNSASQNYFGKPTMYMGMGGTIPFMKMLGDAYPQTQFVVTGRTWTKVERPWSQRVFAHCNRQEDYSLYGPGHCRGTAPY